jgi:protein-S-isoprenylcysteine O-methyltransferase Ste14
VGADAILRWLHLAAVAGFAVLLLARVAELRWRQGVEAMMLFRGSKDAGEKALELAIPILGSVWLGESVLYGLGAGSLFPAAFNRTVLPLPFGLLGVMVECGALALFALALRHMGRSLRLGVDRAKPGPLVTTGVFGLSRNPIFLAMMAMLWGSFLVAGTLPLAVAALLGSLLIHRQIRHEERFLAEKFGAAYAAYRRRVGRYFGI